MGLACSLIGMGWIAFLTYTNPSKLDEMIPNDTDFLMICILMLADFICKLF